LITAVKLALSCQHFLELQDSQACSRGPTGDIRRSGKVATATAQTESLPTGPSVFTPHLLHFYATFTILPVANLLKYKWYPFGMHGSVVLLQHRNKNGIKQRVNGKLLLPTQT
jgi:hypothetical protein